MTPALTAALEAVYDAFRAPTPARIEGCPCCVERKTVKALHTHALRDLTADDLGAYAASVFLTVGASRDFRYFLPRILELAISDPSFSIGIEVVVGKLSLAEWRTWTRHEQAAVQTLLEVWFDQVAAECASDWDGFDDSIDELLCAIGRAGLDPIPFIERQLTDERSFALNVLWEVNRQSIARKGRLSNAFWADAVDAQAAVVRRLLAPDIQAIVA